MKYPSPSGDREETGPAILKWTAGTLAACGLAVVCIVVVMSDGSRKQDPPQSVLTHVADPGSFGSSTAMAGPAGFGSSLSVSSDREVRWAKPAENPWRKTFDAIAIAGSDVDRDVAINALVGSLDSEALISALHFLSSQEPDGWSREISRRMMHHLAEIDPARAAGEVEAWPEGAGKDRTMEDVATVWANGNATDAANWVRQWPDPQLRDQGMTGVAYEVARSDALAAMSLAVALAPGPGRDDLISHVAAQWTISDPKAAAEWAQKIPDPALREKIAGTVATELADRDPMAAATMAATQLPIGKLRDDTVIGIVERWVQIDPKGAQAWVQQFPSGPIRETALENLAKLWPERNRTP